MNFDFPAHSSLLTVNLPPGFGPNFQDGEMHEPFGRGAPDNGPRVPAPGGAAHGHHFLPLRNEARVSSLHDDFTADLHPLAQAPEGIGNEEGGGAALELIGDGA